MTWSWAVQEAGDSRREPGRALPMPRKAAGDSVLISCADWRSTESAHEREVLCQKPVSKYSREHRGAPWPFGSARNRMTDFKGVAEKFHVSLVPDDGASQRVICQARLARHLPSAKQTFRAGCCPPGSACTPATVQVGLDGLFLLSPDTQRTLRKFPLQHISRWALRGTRLVLYTRTPADLEEQTLTLQADDRTICSVLDTLTCSCMQCAPSRRLTARPPFRRRL